jgi:small subunit ribosomal protein S6e
MQKIVVSDPKSGRAYNIELDEAKAKTIIGLEVGKEFDGAPIGLSGYKLKITGGTDKDGFPIRPSVHGRARKKVLMKSGPGFRPKESGYIRRKSVRGRVITPEVTQVNAVVVKAGKKSLEKILAGPEEEKKEE